MDGNAKNSNCIGSAPIAQHAVTGESRLDEQVGTYMIAHIQGLGSEKGAIYRGEKTWR